MKQALHPITGSGKGRVIRAHLRLLLLALMSAAVAACATDPLLPGTWQLVVSMSKYIPGPALRSQTRTYEANTDGVKVTIRTVLASGESTTIEYPANEDGKDYPVTGSPGSIDAISMEKTGDHVATSILKHAGKEMGVAERTISGDGKTMTITYKTKDGTLNNTAVYAKQ